jgi:CubicO group peptidase (beta-lactamase class C family)
MCSFVIIRHVAGALAAAAIFVALMSAAAAQSDPFAKISERMEGFVAEGQISGAVTLVAQHGRVVHLAAVGKADLEHDTPMATDSIFRIASMTKPVTATAIMILADEGKLSIDDPVEKYIPAFANVKYRGAKPAYPVTIRHLLTHTSGLGGRQECEKTLAATADMLAARPLEFQPGQWWDYSPGMNVCGRIIEVVSGQPYQDYLAERIFRPLGMKDTTFYPTPDQCRRLAVAYVQNNDGPKLVPATGLVIDKPGETAPSPSGGLYSTAGDMFRFYQMILNGGELEGRRIVSAEAVQAMTTVQTGDLKTGFTPGNGWGLGWCIVRQPQGVTGMLSPGTFGHGGAIGTQGWIDPRRQAIFLLMIQRADLPNSDGTDMRREFQRLAADALDRP